jgi:hypothetical protein
MLEEFNRPLTEAERRLVRGWTAFRRRQIDAMPKRTLCSALVVIGALWLATILASNANRVVISAFWLLFGIAMWLWVYTEERRKLSRQIRTYESAIRRNEATVVRVVASAVVELEEYEDEGLCHAFQIDEDSIAFTTGQDYYDCSSRRFPNSDFSIINILDEGGEVAHIVMAKHGRKLEPVRKIPADVKLKLRQPGDLEVISGRLADLERLLAQ